MSVRSRLLSVVAGLLWTFICYGALTQAALLDPGAAFKLRATVFDPNTVQLNWTIQPGYFLYQKRIHIEEEASPILQLGGIRLPPALHVKVRQSHVRSVYQTALQIMVPVLGLTAGEARIVVRYQGCAASGYCYPPQVQRFIAAIGADRALLSFIPDVNTAAPPRHADSKPQTVWLMMISFLGFGILLAFTPCMLPMVPVLSSMLLRNRAALSTRQAFFVSFSYVLGVASTYALLGAGFALMGRNLQLVFQTPIAKGSLALLFTLLALSMFGLFKLALPMGWGERWSKVFHQRHSGSYLSTFMLGMLSILILSPCVTPPLVGGFMYVGETGHVLSGMMALFCLGLGSGIPLLLLSLSAAHYLPRVGHWMRAINVVFGVLLLAVSLHLVWDLLNMQATRDTHSVQTLITLQTTLLAHKGQPIVLDYDAAWCESCRRVAKTVLRDPTITPLLKQVRFVKVDVTSQEVDDLYNAFHVVGPPTFIFIRPDGQEMQRLRIVGEPSIQTMRHHLYTLLQAR